MRTEIAAAIAAMDRVKHAVEQSFQRTGMPPATLADLGARLPQGSDLVESVRIENGRIELEFSAAADAALTGQSLYLTPFETVDQDVVWVCGNRLPGVGLNPLGFAGGSNVVEQEPTLIEPRYLPRWCR